MKSIIPAALVVVLEAGFLFSIASLPSPAPQLTVQVQVAKAAPSQAKPAPPASVPVSQASRS